MKAISFHYILKSIIYERNQFRPGGRKVGKWAGKEENPFKFILFIHSLKRKFIAVFPQVRDRENGLTPALSKIFTRANTKIER